MDSHLITATKQTNTCPRESAKLEAVAVQVEGCPLRGGGDITRQVQEESLEAFIQREISQHQVTQDPSRSALS